MNGSDEFVHGPRYDFNYKITVQHGLLDGNHSRKAIVIDNQMSSIPDG